MTIHETYMQRCLQLAEKGLGYVAPNPMVGSVIVHEQKVIGEGYHQQYGQAHAEVNAVNAVVNKELLQYSTLYVNLEPCAHYGKTPPCADLIIKYKIPNVVIGSVDFNSVVNGRGIEKMIKAGINVTVGVLEEDCKLVNKRFFAYHQKKRPYIILKWAQTADGFIDRNRYVKEAGQPLQISNSGSRRLVHLWRSQEQAIMVGTNTALLDNPQLTVRECDGKNPVRVVIDKEFKIPLRYNLFDKSTPTLVFTALEGTSAHNLEFIKLDFEKAVLPAILKELHDRNIQSLFVEGGAHLINSFIGSGLWDEARVFVANEKIEEGVPAPVLNAHVNKEENCFGDKLLTFIN